MSIDQASPEEWDALTALNNLSIRKPIDPVNKPDHYNKGAVEAIEAIKASMHPQEYKGYLKGNCMKYLWRYERKGKQLQDLHKAKWYLNRLITDGGIE